MINVICIILFPFHVQLLPDLGRVINMCEFTIHKILNQFISANILNNAKLLHLHPHKPQIHTHVQPHKI